MQELFYLNKKQLSIPKAKIFYNICMRSKKNVETIKLEEGRTLEATFDNYVEMAASAVDWTLFCTYQLKPDFSEGSYKILQLPSMQIASTDMLGGVMFDYVAPEGCITLSIMSHISSKACIDQMKLESGMIAVVDDRKVYNFICSGRVKLIDISLNENADPLLRERLESAVDRYYMDESGSITRMVEEILDRYAEHEELDAESYGKIEKRISEEILSLTGRQEAQTPRFTGSEKIALKIKEKLFRHMDGKMTTASLAEEYGLSCKSLQNAFKSLFDLNPRQFVRLLKLNLVHHELSRSDPSQINISRVAQKWGFEHQGRFAKYYAELFGENPSATLRRVDPMTGGMQTHCVERQEEME